MLKTSIRRILALVCVISLMVTNCFVLTPQVVAEAGDETPATLKSMTQEGYTVVTPQTFGVPDASYASGETTNKEDVSLNKLLFAADLTYDGTGAGNFYYLQGSGNKTVWWMQFQKGGGAIYFYNQFDYSAKSDMYRGDSGEDSKTYGGNSSSNRFSLKPAEFGLTSFQKTDFSFWITTEFVDAPFDDDDTADDVKIGLWVNGKLYTYNGVDTYFYVLDCAENTYKGYLKHNARFAISTPAERFEDVTSTMPEGYKIVTPLTFGVPDTTGAAVEATKTEGISLDKLLFAANVTREDDGTTSNTSLDYLLGPAGQNICRLQMRPGDNRIYIYNLFDYSAKTVMYRGDSGTSTKSYGSKDSSNYFSMKPSEFGLTSFKGTELEIWITTEFVKAPWLTEGEADDLKIGIWINGQLYTRDGNGTYFYVLDCKENAYRGDLRTSNEKLAISSPFMEPNDMGMVGGEYASAGGEFYDSTTTSLLVNKLMDGTTFHSSVRFEGEGGTLYYGSKNDANAIKLTSTEDGILVTYGAEELIVINQNTVGIPTLNNNFNLKLKTEFVNCDDDETTDDVKLGIYVDNKYKSFDLVDAAATLTATIGVKTTGDATVLVGDFASTTPEQVSWDLNDGAYTKEKTDGVTRISVDGVSVDGNLELNTVGNYSVVVTKDGKVYMEDVTISGDSTEPPVNPEEPKDPEEPPVIPITPLKEPTLPEITFSDFNIGDGTYSYNNKSLAISGKYSEGVANKSFVGTFNFSTTDASDIRIGGVENGWYGVKLMGSGTTLKFLEAREGIFKAVTINQNDVAVPLKEKDVRFKLSIEVVNLDNDNQMDDVRFWLYFEDVLYQGKPIVEVIDYAQSLGNYVGIYSNKATSSVTIKSANLNRPKEEIDFSIMGFTKDWKQTLISTKGTASGTGSSINRAPYTGEQSTAGIYLVMSVLSLAAVAYVLWVKRSKMSE